MEMALRRRGPMCGKWIGTSEEEIGVNFHRKTVCVCLTQDNSLTMLAAIATSGPLDSCIPRFALC